jgi:hypothetical protein
LQTTLVYLHLTDDGKDDGRAKLDEIAQPGDLFRNKFAKTNKVKPKAGKRNSGQRNAGNRKPK